MNRSLVIALLMIVMGPKGMVEIQRYQNGYMVMDLETGKNTLVTRQQDGVMILPDDNRGEIIDTLKPMSVPLNFNDDVNYLEQ